MVVTIEALKQKKELLDQHRPLPNEVINNLLEWFKIEITYSSNAIEGNTLSRLETAVVVQQGITIGGKLLKEHLEAINHANAFDFIISLINHKSISEQDILKIHQLVLDTIDKENAGRYRNVAIRIAGSEVIFPNYAKVPELMTKFVNSLREEQDVIKKALMAHYQLVSIHPFVDGNGRTARLLMNLLLMQAGYPPAIIKPQDRLKYLKTLEQAQLTGSKEAYQDFIISCIDKSLEIYLKSINNDALPLPLIKPQKELIKIGDLSKLTNESASTLRYWLKLGLITATNKTETGYHLFDKTAIDKCKRIRFLQGQRLNLEEILTIIITEFKQNER